MQRKNRPWAGQRFVRGRAGSGTPTFGWPWAVLLADMNDDGQEDILATSGSKVCVLLNDSAP